MITGTYRPNASGFLGLPAPPTLFDGNNDSLFRDIFVSIPQTVGQQAPAINVSEKDASEDSYDYELEAVSSGCKSKRTDKKAEK